MGELTLVSKPSLLSSDDWSEDIAGKQDSWQRTTNAVGGYWLARFRLTGSQSYLEDWFDRRLESTITEYGPGGIPRWEGYVSKLKLTIARGQMTRDLEAMANKIKVVYSTVDYSTDPPTIGAREETGWASDASSIAKWGTKEAVLSTGGMDLAGAEELRDLFLEIHREPVVTRSATVVPGEQGNVLEVECLGFVQTLNWLTYTSATTGNANANTVIQAILAAAYAVNPFLSDDYSFLVTNGAVQVPQYYSQLRYSWDIIKSIIARGDGTDPWVGGVFQGRIFRYRKAATEISLYRELSDPVQRFYSVTGVEVEPWEVTPDAYMKTRDAMMGRATPSDLRQDPRITYLDSVTFTAPRSLRWVGRGDQALEVLLAKYGQQGVGI